MKQIITLQDGSFVEINGIDVKHVREDGQILYDSTKRILYDQEQIDHLRKKWKSDIDEKVKNELERCMPFLEETSKG